MVERHALFGPSSSERWINCPGYVMLQRSVERKPAGRAAREGTVCHALLEASTFGMDPAVFLGKPFVKDEPIVVSSEMVQAVNDFNEHWRQLREEYGIPETVVDEPEQWLEDTSMPRIEGVDDVFGGTADRVTVHEGTLLVGDMKFGAQHVSERSPQLACYAIMRILQLAASGHAIDRVAVAIYQPRGYLDEPFRVHRPSLQELHDVYTRVRASITLVAERWGEDTVPLELLHDGSHCAYCPCAGVNCTQVANRMSEALAFVESDKVPREVEDLRFWAEREDAMRAFFKNVNTAMLRLAQSGVEIPGKKLVARYGHRTWAGMPADREGSEFADWVKSFLRKIARVTGQKGSTFQNKTLCSPAQAESTLKRLKVEKSVRDKLLPLMDRPVTGAKLVDVEAGGDAVTPAQVEDFLKAQEMFGE